VRWQSVVWTYRTAVVRRVYAQHPSSHRVLVRYEDLVADPAHELYRVCGCLGLDAGPARLAAVAEAHAFEAVPVTDRGEGKEIRSATPGGWRTNLTAAEQDVMHELMGPTLVELGYSVPSPVGR
jgi:hypothetical protein